MRDFSRGAEHLAINQWTTRPWSLAEAIEGYARHGVRGIAVWRDKLAELGVGQAASMLKAHDMAVTGPCRARPFPAPRPPRPQAAPAEKPRAPARAGPRRARRPVI